MLTPSSSSKRKETSRPRFGRFRLCQPAPLVLAVLLVLLVPVVSLAELPKRPPFYAIHDARIVTVSGAILPRADVIVSEGLIVAIGPDLTIPGDAWVLEGAGFTVYPGLIDVLGSAGAAAAAGPAGAGEQGRPGGGPQRPSNAPEIRGPEDRPQTTPWVTAADTLDPMDGRIEKWRAAGFTSVLISADTGLAPGWASLINLGGSEKGEMIVEAEVAQRLNLSGGSFRSFPGSLMGVISYQRQLLLDARHYAAQTAWYEKNPLGKERPAYDRTLEPLARALSGKKRFLMPAQSATQIDRALRFANELELQVTIFGGQASFERAAELAKAKVPVIVALKWPEADKDRDPEAEEEFRELTYRALAPTSAMELARAGALFTFSSAGLGSPSQAFEGVRKAISAGLSVEQALRAMTLDAAKILGVDSRLGSIEKGKIANLILADHDPWESGVAVKAVFVDGRLFEAPPKKQTPSAAPAHDVTGTWKATLETPRGETELTLELAMTEDGSVQGEVNGPRGRSTIEEGRVDGEEFRFKVSSDAPDGRSFEISYAGTLAGESLRGTMTAGPRSSPWSAERTSKEKPSGVGSEKPSGPAVPFEELRRTNALFHGKARDLGDFAIVNATVWTVSGDTLPGAGVLVRNGKIAAVGLGLRIPPGVETIDAAGGHLIPGIIDAHSHIAVEGGVNEGSLAVTAMVGTDDVVDPDDISIYRALAGGVTSANLLHGSANPIGGRNQVIKLRWGSDAAGLVFAGAPPGIKFALGENPKRSRGGIPGSDQRYPATRMGVLDTIREAFLEARAYQADWQGYETRRKRGEDVIAPRVDLKLQNLAEVLEGKRLVHAHSYRADEILQLLRLAEEFGFRIATLQHVLEGYKVADEIARHGAGASTFSDWWGYKVEAYDAIPYNAAIMTRRGVVVSINSDSEEEMRHLNQEAAKTIHWGGLTEKEALALVTLNPAKQLRIDRWVGSIEVGKDADLVLYDGHPLSPLSLVEKTFVDGELYFDRDLDRDRQRAIEDVKKRLADKKSEAGKEEKAAPSGAETPAPAPAAARTESVSAAKEVES